MNKKTEPKPDWHDQLHGHKPADVIDALELAFRYAQTAAGATKRCRKKVCRDEGRCQLTIEAATGDALCPAGLRTSEFESGVLMLGFLAELWRVKVGGEPPRPGEFERLMERRAQEESDPQKALLARADAIDRQNGWGRYNTGADEAALAGDCEWRLDEG